MNINDQSNLTQTVDKAARNLCPDLLGVSFPDIEDTSTWFAHYKSDIEIDQVTQDKVANLLNSWVTNIIPELPDISDRQFGQGLWMDGLIKYQEYIDFIGIGKLPDAVLAVVNSPAFPDDDTGNPTPRKILSGQLIGARAYTYNNPLIEAFRAQQATIDDKWTVDYLRDRWLAWSTL